MTKIIGISGRKQAGKNTIANYINGDILKNKSMIQDYRIDDNGSLNIKTVDNDHNSGWGIFDVTRKDDIFVDYAERELWPYIKVYHFADPLKEMSINIFGLNPLNIYGTDQQKNELTTLKWEEMPTETDKTGFMSHREFLEYYGTKVIRKIKTDAWVNATLNKITKEKSEISIIPDVRFPNEVKAIQDLGGIVVRLTRDMFNSKSESESALDSDRFNWAKFDILIDNHNMTMNDLVIYLQSKTFWR
jgi:hypothetical protein